MKILILANLGYFWPVMNPVSVSKALNVYICPSSDLIESEWQENFKQH